ncbi:hypothetical protein DFH09DRAFT_1262627 [Mycena vulgaris]|nr:hypothetical protein DFH09DRAFT_1262627 [Mycena vulgaris]
MSECNVEQPRERGRLPKPVPAYLPTTGSPLTVDKELYAKIWSAPRVLVEEFRLEIRSGRAWTAPAGSIVQISTPEGPQVAWYGADAHGGRVHDLLGTRCDPYVNTLLSGEAYDFHCHLNLVRAVLPFGLAEADVHDVLKLFQVTGLNDEGRYCMSPCPARKGDYVEMLAEVDLLLALSTCPGGDLSLWGFGADSEKEMVQCCRPLDVKVFRLEDESLLRKWGWKMPEPAPYRGLHGMTVPQGEARS